MYFICILLLLYYIITIVTLRCASKVEPVYQLSDYGLSVWHVKGAGRLKQKLAVDINN